MYAATFLSLPVAGLLWLNMDHSFQQRLETLSSSKQLSDDARWAHWRDTVTAVPDAPLGFGLGTYRYANRPYQKHAARGWYYNADNQYVETLIELGPAGLLAVIAGVMALFRAAYRAWRDQRSDYRDVALLLTLLVLSQSQTSLTDYGIVMPANLLAAALLVGAALAAVSTSAVAVRAPAVSGLVAIICGTFLFALPAVGLAEVHHAAQQRAFVDQIPSLNHPIHRVELDEIDSLISAGTALTQRRPDDAALQQALADLWIYRFRLEASAELQIYVPSLSPLQAWEFSSPLNLLRQSVEVLRTTGPGGLEALRSNRVMVDNLAPAWTHLQQARAACRYAPRTHLLLGCLSVLMAEDDRTALNHLKHEVALSPFDAGHLVAAGLMIRQLGDDRTTYSLWKRALTLNPELARRLFQAVLREVDNSTMLSMAIPDSIPVLLRFAESTPSDPARQAAVARLEALLPTDERATGYDHWVRGRIAALQQNWDAAIASYERAVAAQPFDVEYRVDLAAALEHQERWDEAIQQLIRGQRTAPHRKDLAEKVRRLYQKQAEYRPRNTSTSESESHTPHTSDSTPAQSPGDDAG